MNEASKAEANVAALHGELPYGRDLGSSGVARVFGATASDYNDRP